MAVCPNNQVKQGGQVEWEQAVAKQTYALEEWDCSAQQLAIDWDDSATQPNNYEHYLEKQRLVISIGGCTQNTKKERSQLW